VAGIIKKPDRVVAEMTPDVIAVVPISPANRRVIETGAGEHGVDASIEVGEGSILVEENQRFVVDVHAPMVRHRCNTIGNEAERAFVSWMIRRSLSK
jgi:hypothetical protein